MDYTILSTTKTDEQGRPLEPGAINGGMMKRTDPVSAPPSSTSTTSTKH
jgi:hypothetical protein